jgi:alkylation response protein AidB-like acyl-CoA dehydrogenase
VVRRAWLPNENQEVVKDVLAALSTVGLLGMLAPTELGGSGGDELDFVVALEECGRFAAPGPLVEHIAVGVPALAAVDHPQASDAAAGVTIVTARETGRNRVAYAELSELCVLTDESALAPNGGWAAAAELALVDQSLRSAMISVSAQESLGDCNMSLCQDRAALGVAAQLIGLAEAALSMTVDYVKSRRQFGVPVGSQQAVKHALASTLIAIQHARPVVYRAAYALANREPAGGRDVSFAKVYAYRAAYLTSRTALQCHGAIGYTIELDLHMWMKRIWSLAPAWGTVAEHERRVSNFVLADTSH